MNYVKRNICELRSETLPRVRFNISLQSMFNLYYHVEYVCLNNVGSNCEWINNVNINDFIIANNSVSGENIP